ncbi:RNI-like protein [Auricularia subglabra TFB-10046 SS5]|nr:RNI-like protein [Auricularia subglabra TFB-10046 SS5]
MSSSAPSSSAVTIPRPGKSILKPPAPPPRPLFSLSTLSKLVSTGQTADAAPATLKRAHFIMPQLVTVYPICASNPPSTPTIKEEKRAVEEKEKERRRRVMRGNSFTSPGPALAASGDQDDWWTADKVVSFYNECCVGREEEPQPQIVAALRAATTSKPRSLDLTGIPLTLDTTQAVTDLLNVEWGVRKLVLKNCDLDDVSIKPVLHALLIPCSITFLSLAGNKRLKSPGFRLLGSYISGANTLQFLDLSQTNLDKKSVEYIVAALGSIPPQHPNGESTATNGSAQPAHSKLESLRLDDCNLRAGALEVLAHAVRTSALRNISLRQNRISNTGAVALALMIKDYPDSVPLAGVSGLASPPPTPIATTAPPTPISASSALPPPPVRHDGPIKPPPRHPAMAPAPAVATTYTPYVPRARRGTAGSAAPLATTRITFAPPDRSVPVITSSREGGVTTRHPPVDGHSAALYDKVRALDALPRLGALRTLDLRGNEIRNGVTYIAQVLKRNRTLKVLNLCENKIDVQGLSSIAEALKYNTCLETLDLSKNPCCSPGLEGITSLRTAFTLNKSLKRLFLSGTGLTSAGAIALAEFLPESTSLLHLDLTQNTLDLAGVMALSGGLKANWTMRCLDLNIPVGDENMARLCREILSICVRNTEKAEESVRGAGGANGVVSSGRGLGKGVWGMIEESQLAKSIRRTNGEATDLDIIQTARDCRIELEAILSATSSGSSSSSSAQQTIAAPPELVSRTRAALPPLIGLIQSLGDTDPSRLEEMIELNDALAALLARAAPTSPAITRRTSLQIRLGSNVITSPSVSGLLSPTGLLSPAGPLLSPLLQRRNSDKGKEEKVTEEDEEEPSTPKVDKGKGRLVIEEKVIPSPSASFAIGDGDSDGEDEGKHAGALVNGLDDDDGEAKSPTVDIRSKNWVVEEGEVFRKGVALLKPEEMEEEYDTEELRKELLEAEVERHPVRQYDALGMPIDEGALRAQQLAADVHQSEENAASPPQPTPGTPPVAAYEARPAFPRRASQSSVASSSSVTVQD